MKSKSYEEFVEKFKPKKTTDDCYTPPKIYDVIKDYACEKYNIDPDKIVRPFWPGGDYKNFDYPEGCVVLDNPPFSILAQICDFYLERGIPFFLFAPTLTAFSGRKHIMQLNHIIAKADIVYENGAKVPTSFVTSYGGDIVAQSDPDLSRLINETMEEILAEKKVTIPKFDYPDHILTAAMLQIYAHRGVKFVVRRNECTPIHTMDDQRKKGKSIYGGGLLLSEKAAAEKAAAEKAAAEKAAAEKWQLSEREWEIVRNLGSD